MSGESSFCIFAASSSSPPAQDISASGACLVWPEGKGLNGSSPSDFSAKSAARISSGSARIRKQIMLL